MVENAAGLIVAAGDEREREMIMPLTKIGSMSLIKRIVLTFQQANISLILVVTGYQALEVERDLAGYGVIFLRNENYESTDKFQSVKMGLEYLQEKCKKVVYTPVNVHGTKDRDSVLPGQSRTSHRAGYGTGAGDPELSGGRWIK